jgi:response regulator RpfG family c-di-GMP phosphodiesterase
MAQMLALKIGWTEKQAAVIKLAASMHDVGKLAIHDSILTKPGALTQSEFAVIQGHCQLGNEMLKCSPRPLLKMAAIIAKEHHESYDGTGYPCQLRADDIHISSRIVALVDVFDALGNRRVYKEPWQSSQIIDYIRNQQGKKFDPQLVDLLLDNVDEFFAVRINFPDGNQASV